jgi:hypothetical protein
MMILKDKMKKRILKTRSCATETDYNEDLVPVNTINSSVNRIAKETQTRFIPVKNETKQSYNIAVSLSLNLDSIEHFFCACRWVNLCYSIYGKH